MSLLMLAAQAQAKRTKERADGSHLCLSVWRGGDVAHDKVDDQIRPHTKEAAPRPPDRDEEDALGDGAPIAFALCRRRWNRHQQWERTRAQGSRNAFHIRSIARPHLCVTVPPIFFEREDGGDGDGEEAV